MFNTKSIAKTASNLVKDPVFMIAATNLARTVAVKTVLRAGAKKAEREYPEMFNMGRNYCK